MSTDALRFPGLTLTLGADGNRPATTLPSDGCCSDPLCQTAGESACSFVDLLPSGPMWDRSKAELVDVITECGVVPTETTTWCRDVACPSMVMYGVYLSSVLQHMTKNMLVPSFREADPRTATTTLDEWLVRYNWADCYRCDCNGEYANQFSPYRNPVSWGCLTCCCEPYLPEDFECAMKYALVQSLRRRQRGVIGNLDGINWVIAPLGAAVRPRAYPDNVQAYIDGTCTPAEGDGPPCWCEEVALEIYPTTTTLPKCPTELDFCRPEGTPQIETVEAEQIYYCKDEEQYMGCADFHDCDADRTRIHPAVLAAECVVRSILKRQCPNILYRDAAVVDRRELP